VQIDPHASSVRSDLDERRGVGKHDSIGNLASTLDEENQPVGWKHHDGNIASAPVLLMKQVLVAAEKNRESIPF